MNSGCRPWLLVVVLVLAALSGSGVAHAAGDPVEAAREHYDRGSRLYALGKFDEAVREYEAAYEAKDFPEFLFNIAQCYRLSGNASRALFFFKSYLTRLPQAPNRAEVEGRIVELEHKVDAERRDAEEERMRVAAAAALVPPRRAVDLTSARRERIAGIITGSVGLVALAGGLACNGLAVKETGDLRNEARSNSAFDPSIESRGRAFNVAGPALDVIGGVALATGAVLLGIGEWQIHRAHQDASVRAASEIAP